VIDGSCVVLTSLRRSGEARGACARPDSGDVLTYAWEANGGVFAEPTQPSTNWTAPVGADTYQITITVRDPKDAGAVMSVDIAVAAGNARARPASPGASIPGPWWKT